MTANDNIPAKEQNSLTFPIYKTWEEFMSALKFKRFIY